MKVREVIRRDDVPAIGVDPIRTADDLDVGASERGAHDLAEPLVAEVDASPRHVSLARARIEGDVAFDRRHVERRPRPWRLCTDHERDRAEYRSGHGTT